MNPQDFHEYVSKVRKQVVANRPLWYRMSKAGVVSYRYLVRFADGDYRNPTIDTLAAIEQFIDADQAAA